MPCYGATIRRRYDGLFTIRFPDLPGAIAFGRDHDEAIEEGRRSARAAIERLRAAGETIPPPLGGRGELVPVDLDDIAALLPRA